MTEIKEKIDALLERIPPEQKLAAAALLAQYGPRLFDMALDDAWGYLRRLMNGDLDAAAELDAQLTDAEFIARVKANTARWEAVAGSNRVRDELRNELLLRLAPVVASILAGLVGL